jgi:hypothetical protein
MNAKTLKQQKKEKAFPVRRFAVKAWMMKQNMESCCLVVVE